MTPYGFGWLAKLSSATQTSHAFGPDKSLTVLLTTESLLFAVFALALSLGTSSLPVSSPAAFARKATIVVAVVLTVLGAGAAMAWADLFIKGTWPHGFVAWFPVVAIAVGAVCQPVFAWVIVRNLN